MTMMAAAQRSQSPKIFFADLGNDIPDRRQSVLVVTIATLAISTIFIAARLVSRLFIVRRVTWDDYLIVFGWVSFPADISELRPSRPATDAMV